MRSASGSGIVLSDRCRYAPHCVKPLEEGERRRNLSTGDTPRWLQGHERLDRVTPRVARTPVLRQTPYRLIALEDVAFYAQRAHPAACRPLAVAEKDVAGPDALERANAVTASARRRWREARHLESARLSLGPGLEREDVRPKGQCADRIPSWMTRRDAGCGRGSQRAERRAERPGAATQPGPTSRSNAIRLALDPLQVVAAGTTGSTSRKYIHQTMSKSSMRERAGSIF